MIEDKMKKMVHDLNKPIHKNAKDVDKKILD